MKNFDIKNNVNDANASGRGLSSAPWMNCNKSSYDIKEVQDGGWQSGRSMIEMLGVLAIIGVLSVGGIAGYSKAMSKYRINKAVEQITLISGNIRSFFGQQKNYAEVACSGWYCTASGCPGFNGFDNDDGAKIVNNGCPIIKKAKIFPDEMIEVKDGKIMSITNPFGYEAGIYGDNKSTEGDNQAFSIYYYIGKNMEACIELLTQDWSTANVKAIMLFGDTDSYYYKTPIAVDDAVNICDIAVKEAGGSYPVIYFYFDIDLNSSYWSSTTWKN